MRRVILDISKLGLIVGDTISIELVNSVGGIHPTYIFKKDFVLDAELFDTELLENEDIDIDVLSMYKLTLPNKLTFIFSIPKNRNGTPHDLLSLLRLACYEGIINKASKTLSVNFIKKLNIYFTGENPHFTKTESDVVKLYEYYANDIKATESTIDIIEIMDDYLATIRGEI